MSANDLLIGIVGPCSAGKTTLIAGLSAHGHHARHIAQEHSYVPDMWKRLAKPDVLIYLDVTYLVSMKRRPLEMSVDDFAEQCARLEHARQHADLYIFTDELTPQQVLQKALNFIDGRS
jgi:hypothetical protein